MAAAIRGNPCLPNFTTATPTPRKPLRPICSNPTLTPRKFIIRKNYLRQKLLKTLTKPCPNSLVDELTEANPLIPIEIQSEEGLKELEIQEFREVEVKESADTLDGFVGNVPKVSIFKYGLWLYGAIVFQTIFSVWKYVSFEFDDKKGNDVNSEHKNGVLEVGLNGKGKSQVKSLRNASMGLGNGGAVYVDEGEMEKQIEEIRIMAREARERERLEAKKDGYESDDSDKEAESEFGKSGIEKEVSDRLVKLGRRLENGHGKLPSASVDNVKKDFVNGKNNLGRKESNEALMFKKKYRFRDFSSRPNDKSKGFTGTIDDRNGKDGGSEVLMNGDDERDDVEDLLDNVLKMNAQGADSGTGISMHSEEDGGRKQVREATKSSRTAGNKSSDVSNEHDELNKTGNLKSRKIEVSQSTYKLGHKKSESETEPWWSSLPYVLVILMHGELDGTRTGLFTLRNNSYDKSDLSHTVAFEDRGDATNFCYLVQSFFEDLEDFSAEIVPLPIKELSERVKSQAMKVIVVKKGQLKLYAGQPLQDVEMALSSLVEES